jgi:hypothetical protein
LAGESNHASLRYGDGFRLNMLKAARLPANLLPLPSIDKKQRAGNALGVTAAR